MDTKWPLVAGTYQVGDPMGPIAVCALTSERLVGPLVGLPGVAIAGIVYTANLGISRIITNIPETPSIRSLLICGRDPPILKPGQSLAALAERGIDNDRRIVGAEGYEPVLTTTAPDQVHQFRRQVEVLDWGGEEDVEALKTQIGALFARSPGAYKAEANSSSQETTTEHFAPIRPGGIREPLLYDPKGYFVISLDREKGEIILRHYLPSHTPAHEMRGRGATSMLLGLLREGLVTQLSHAGYLGEELAKAQTALQFGLRYDQDRPLRQAESTIKNAQETPMKQDLADSPATETPPKMPTIQLPMTLKEFQTKAQGSKADIVITVTGLLKPNTLSGTMLESSEAEPFNAFHRTQQEVEVDWDASTRVIMGVASEIEQGALLRISGLVDEKRTIHADAVVILTKVARIL